LPLATSGDTENRSGRWPKHGKVSKEIVVEDGIMESLSLDELKARFRKEYMRQLEYEPDFPEYVEGLWDGYKAAFKSMGVLKE
jgi:hypothetical protein